MRVLVIIPAYNEGAVIRKVVEDFTAWKSALPDTECGCVVIDDGSLDDTAEVLRGIGCPVISLPMNLGIGGAVQTGYMYALREGYDAAVQMDGDGQHLPEYIDTLLRPVLSGEADLALGSRFLEEGGFRSSALRRCGIRFLSGIIRLVTGEKLYDVTSGFRAADRKAIRLFARKYAKDYPEPESLVQAIEAGLCVKEVPVRMSERRGGESSIGGLRSAYYMVKVTLAILIAGMQKKKAREDGK